MNLAPILALLLLPPLAGDDLEIVELGSPARSGSGAPGLHEGADGKLYLTWIEGGDHRAWLSYSTLDAGGERWSPASRIAAGEKWFVNWADRPGLCALEDGSLAAHWLVRSGKHKHAYDVWFSTRAADATEWTRPQRLHDDTSPAEHGFVSWQASGDRFVAVWLGGAPFGGGPGATSLMTREVTPAGERLPETNLDPRICSCCPTDLLDAGEGELLAVYRDRSDSEVRDISFVRRTEAGWTDPERVFADGWTMPGCPVNGPVLAERDGHVAAAWFTGAGDDGGRVNVAFEKDGRFGFPVRVDEGTPVGRPDLVVLEGGDAVVLWLEADGNRAEWRVRLVPRDPEARRVPRPSRRVAEVANSRTSGYAQLARHGESLVFAWVEPARPSRVRTALLDLPR